MGVVAYPLLASVTELVTFGLPATALGAVTSAQQTGALQAATDFAYARMSARFPATPSQPWTSWDTAVLRNVCKLAAKYVMEVRGWNPSNEGDKSIVASGDAAEAWFKDVETQNAHPAIVSSMAPNAQGQTANPIVLSMGSVDTRGARRTDAQPNRGW
jgi:hypothetical protein